MANVAYITGVNPWGTGDGDGINVSLNNVFGAGNWDSYTGFALPTLNDYDFIYVDGSDGNYTDFDSFLGANLAALDSWVTAGGVLFINAARWTYNDLSLGFGITMHNDFSISGSAADGSHPIFDNDGLGGDDTGLAWYGGYFSHDSLTGTLDVIILDSDGDTILGDKDWGAGHVIFGGITSDFFHYPTSWGPGDTTKHLLDNIFDYAGSFMNDAPVVSGPVTSTATEDAAPYSVSLLAGASDGDGDTMSITGLSHDSGDDAGIIVNGTNLDIDPDAYDYLAVGESAVIDYSYTIEDGNGGSVAQTAQITITGVNDGPTANNDMLGVGSVNLIANGGFETGSTGWTLTNAGSGGWSVQSGTMPPSGAHTTPGAQSGTYYIVSYQSGPGVHALEQSFTVPVGTLSVSLGFAMFAQTYAGEYINVAGLNHGASPNQHARVDLLIDGSAALSTAGSDIVRNFYLGIDGAPTQPWTVYDFDITGNVVAGSTFDLRFAQVDNQDFFNLGVDAVFVIAEVQSALTDEDTAIIISGDELLANDTDPDTTDVLSISGVSALSLLGAAVTLNGDGTVTYDPTGALDYLAQGEVVEDTFTYTISDGNGGSDSATVTLSVVGINDGPTAPVDIDGPSGATIAENHAVGTAIGLEADSTDPEGDTITYYFKDGTNTPVQTLGKFTIDANTGVVTLSSAVNYELATSHTLTIFASDGALESSSNFTVTVTNVVEHLFTPGNDVVDFNALPPGAYDLDGAQYDALAGNDFVWLPNVATSNLPGHVWDYNHTFDASAGNDMVQGGDGNDIISGGDGNDRLFGGFGDDRLVGSAGNDILGGGDGSDKLTGSSGRDIFIFTDSEVPTSRTGEHDVITDFKQGEDRIDISALYDTVVWGGLRSGTAAQAASASGYKTYFFTDGGKTWVMGDTNNVAGADFAIELSGSYKLKGTDLVVGDSFIQSVAQWNTATGGLNWAQHHSDYYMV